jgi:hypothetical protein
MTPHALPLHVRIQILLNTLIGERHVRRSLLEEVCELMGTEPGWMEDAHHAAAELLAALDSGAEVDDFDGSIGQIAGFLGASPA